MSDTTIKKALKEYLEDMLAIEGGQSSGETPHYGAFRTLMNSISDSLALDILCNLQPSSEGDIPDCGFFSKSRCIDGVAPGTNPEFGVVELKKPTIDVRETAKGHQVQKYLAKHGMVLVCNYRDFLLVVKDKDGNQHERDFFSLAGSNEEFWELARHPRRITGEHAKRFADILQLISMEKARLSDPKEIARYLALHAKRTLEKLKSEKNGSLQNLYEILEEGIGAKFEGKDEEEAKNVFRSTLVQSIFYGLFSAWVKNDKDGKFHWDSAKYDIPVPVIQELFEQLTMIDKMEKLGLQETLDYAVDTLNRIERKKFLKAFKKDEGAIQHFYELFLMQFDPDVRTNLGVWYTPKEIVKYMVERVDRTLRTEMGYEDGLADSRVYILDPCCGTGAYVMEVLRKIRDIHIKKGDGTKIAAGKVRSAAKERVVGFEFMTAPLMIAHWQINDYLEEIGAPLNYKENEIPKIHLTDSLTGWEESEQPNLPLPRLADEWKSVRKVKQDDPVLVIIGNPPYNSKSNPTGEKRELTKRYSKDLVSKWGIKKNTLTDSYVQFFSVAEKYIVEKREKGIVCFVSNYSYTKREGFVEMRNHLIKGFDKIWIDSLNGSYTENRMKTPDGDNDGSVFETRYNPTGISVGVSVGLFVKNSVSKEHAVVRHRDFWGLAGDKRKQLLESLDFGLESFDGLYEITKQSKWNRFQFSKSVKDDVYRSWPTIAELRKNVLGLDRPAPYITGVMERRGSALIDIDRGVLEDRMKIYFDRNIEWDEFHSLGHELDIERGRYDARKVRQKALINETFEDGNLVPHIFKPFDIRWAYHARTPGIWSCKQDAFRIYNDHRDGFVATRRQKGCSDEGFPIFFTRCLGGDDTARGHSKYFPLTTREVDGGDDERPELFDSSTPKTLDTTPELDRWFTDLGLKELSAEEQLEEMPLLHALAIAWSPKYLRDNEMSLEIDWPRIPMPADGRLAIESVALGREVANLLDTENPVDRVTVGNIEEHLRVIGKIEGDDYRLVTGKPRQTRKWSESGGWSEPEKRSLDTGFKSIGIEMERGLDLLGPPMDIDLNADTYWSGVPRSVWDCMIGGNQPVKGWISSRRKFKKRGGGRWQPSRKTRRLPNHMGSCAASLPSSSWAIDSIRTT